jgi:Na+-driven multidrug efflux pump
MIHVVKLSVLTATLIMTTGWLIGMFLPYYCARLFTTDATLIQLGMKAIRISLLAFPVIGYQMVDTNFFQSIGKIKISIFLSLSRQLLLLIPLLAILPLFLEIDGVWYSMPISDFLSAIIGGWTMIVYMRKFNRMHRESQALANMNK